MKIFKTLAAVFSAVILFTSCASSYQDDASPAVKYHPFTPTGEKIESSIFGRTVEYDGFTPSESCALPVDSGEISEMAEIGKTLSFLTDGALYYLDVETAESGKLLDTSAEIMAADGGSIFLYDKKTSLLTEISPSGDMLSENILTVETDGLAVKDLIVTDSYFCFICTDSSTGISVTKEQIYERKTLEYVGFICENSAMTYASLYRIFGRYKGDSILKLEEDPADSRFANVYANDLSTGDSEKLCSVNIESASGALGYEAAICYREKTDTILVFAAPSSRIIPADDFTPFLAEYSLSDPDNTTLKRFYTDESACDRVFLSAYENVVSVVWAPAGECVFYDYLDPPKSITLACRTSGSYSEIIKKFERDTGVTVKTVSYGLDFQRLDIKLMAGDTDFDIYEPIPMYQTKYYLAGMFEDLSEFEALKARLDGNLSAGYLSGLDGKYIGMPAGTYNFTDPDSFGPDSSVYSLALAKYSYLAKNVDLASGRFDDPDGDDLYKLLKYVYDNPDGSAGKPSFGSGLTMLDGVFLVMNPSCSDKETAAKFLEYVFDNSDYLELGSLDDVYVYWRCFSPDYTGPVFDACAEVLQSDGKTSTIKELAKKTAAEVKMRLEE